MSLPISQGLAVFKYVLSKKLRREKRYPLVLMLEPLFRCNLECAGCGKIQFPEEILSKRLSVEECLTAAEECGAPIVSIPGGEPLLHPEIRQIVDGLVLQKRYVYLCTNALLLKRKMHLFTPSKYLTLSVHLDGLKEEHDQAVCRDGVFDQAVGAIKEALEQGFRVTTNTTLFEGVSPERVRAFFDFAMTLGIEGMMVSPGYAYEKAPNQEHFLKREKSKSYFREVFKDRKKSWRFNQSPFFIKFLMGEIDYECTPWGNPTRNVFGWQKPCYLISDEGYVPTFRELMDSTPWEKYGQASGNPKCADCMVHCGYEPSAVIDTFSSPRKLAMAAREF